MRTLQVKTITVLLSHTG